MLIGGSCAMLPFPPTSNRTTHTPSPRATSPSLHTVGGQLSLAHTLVWWVDEVGVRGEFVCVGFEVHTRPQHIVVVTEESTLRHTKRTN